MTHHSDLGTGRSWRAEVAYGKVLGRKSAEEIAANLVAVNERECGPQEEKPGMAPFGRWSCPVARGARAPGFSLVR